MSQFTCVSQCITVQSRYLTIFTLQNSPVRARFGVFFGIKILTTFCYRPVSNITSFSIAIYRDHYKVCIEHNTGFSDIDGFCEVWQMDFSHAIPLSIRHDLHWPIVHMVDRLLQYMTGIHNQLTD